MPDNNLPQLSEKYRSSLEPFIDNLIYEKNLAHLTNDELTKVKDELYQKLTKHINTSLLVKLSENSPDDYIIFKELVEKDSPPDKLQSFLEEKIPNLNMFISQILLEFRKVYLGVI